MTFSGVNGFKKRSISDQVDSFGYDLTVNVDNTAGSCQVGFSGDNALAAFTFKGGKVLDPAGNFVQSYNADTDVFINGVVRQDSYDYFINGEPIALGYPCNSGRYSWFFVNPQNVNAEIDVDLSGVSPTYETSGSGFYTGSGAPVSAFIINQTPEMRFRIFGAEIDELGSPYFIQSFETGYIADSGHITVSSLRATNSNSIIPIVLHTNFGDVGFDFFVGGNSVSSTPNPQNIYLTISPTTSLITSNVGFVQYSAMFSNAPLGVELDVSLSYESGVTGSFLKDTLVQNEASSYLDGTITGNGVLSAYIEDQITGHDNIRDLDLFGDGSGNVSTAMLYASGPVSLDYYIRVEGKGEGITYSDVMMSGVADAIASGIISLKGQSVPVVCYDVPGTGGENQTATIPVATGQMFLAPTGTIHIHIDPSGYTSSYLVNDVCYSGPITVSYDVLAVGYATGPTLTGTVDSNFNASSIIDPGDYVFTKTFKNIGLSAGFTPLSFFDPVRSGCLTNPDLSVSGLIQGVVTTGGYFDCSELPSGIPVSGIPAQLYCQGVLVPNVSVIQLTPNEGFLTSENSIFSNSGGYTRTTISNQADIGHAFFNQIVNECDFLGQWTQLFSDIKYSGLQLFPEPCPPELNTPSYIAGRSVVQGASKGGRYENFPLVSGHEYQGHYIDLSGYVPHYVLLIDYLNQTAPGVSFQTTEVDNFNGNNPDDIHHNVGRNPIVRGGYQNLQVAYGGIQYPQVNHYSPGTPENAHYSSYNIAVNFPGQSFDGFFLRLVDYEDSFERSLWQGIKIIPDSQVKFLDPDPAMGALFAYGGGGLYNETGYPSQGPQNLKAWDQGFYVSAADKINLRINRTSRSHDTDAPFLSVYNDFKLYGITQVYQKTGTLFIPANSGDTTPDSGILNFSIDGTGGTTKRIVMRSLLESSGFQGCDLTLFQGTGFIAYNGGYTADSVGRDAYFNTSAQILSYNLAPASTYQAAMVLDLPTGSYQLVYRGLGHGAGGHSELVLGQQAYRNPSYTGPTGAPTGVIAFNNGEFYIIESGAKILIGSQNVIETGGLYYVAGRKFVPDPSSGYITAEVFDMDANDGLYLKEISVKGSSFNNSPVDCSIQYNTPSPCQMPVLGWVGSQATIGQMDYAVVRYIWDGIDGGRDLDTVTRALLPGVSGFDIGWSRSNPTSASYNLSGGGTTYIVSVTGANGEALISWGGDNTNSYPGDETILINFKAIAHNYPAIQDVPISLGANWFGGGVYGNSGHITVQFQSFVGGQLVAYVPSGQSTYDWTVISGGRSVQTINTRYNITGDHFPNTNNCGTLHYLPNQQQGYFDYGPGLITLGSNIIHPIHTGVVDPLIGYTTSGATLNYYANGVFTGTNNSWTQSADYAEILDTDYAPFADGSCAIYSIAPIGTTRKFSAIPNLPSGYTRLMVNADPIYNPQAVWYSGVPYTGNSLPTTGLFSGEILSMTSDSIWMEYDVTSGTNVKNVTAYSLSLIDNLTGTWLPFSLIPFGPKPVDDNCESLLYVSQECQSSDQPHEQDVCITGDHITTQDIKTQVDIALKTLGYTPSDSSANSLTVNQVDPTGMYFYTGGIVFVNPRSGDSIYFNSYVGNYSGTFSGTFGSNPIYPSVERTWMYGTDFTGIDSLVSLINNTLSATGYNLWVPNCNSQDLTIHYEYGPLLHAQKINDGYIALNSLRPRELGHYNLVVNSTSQNSGYAKVYLRPTAVSLQARNLATDSWTTLDTHSNINWNNAYPFVTSGYLNDFSVPHVDVPHPDDPTKDQNPSGISGSNFKEDVLGTITVTGLDKCGNNSSVDIKFIKAAFSGSCTPPDPDDDDKDKDHDKDNNNGTNPDPSNPFLSMHALKTGWVLSNNTNYNHYRLLLSGFNSSFATLDGTKPKDFFATNVDFYCTTQSAQYFTGVTCMEGATYTVNINGLASGHLVGSYDTTITPEMSGSLNVKNKQLVGYPNRNLVRFNSGRDANLHGGQLTGYLTKKVVGEGNVFTTVQGAFYDDPVNEIVSFYKTIQGHVEGCGQISGGPFNVIDENLWNNLSKTLTMFVSKEDTIMVSGVAPHVPFPYPVDGLDGFAYVYGTLTGYVDGTGSYTFDQTIQVIPDSAYQNSVESYQNASAAINYANLVSGDALILGNGTLVYRGVAAQNYNFTSISGLVNTINSYPDEFMASATLYPDSPLSGTILLSSLLSGDDGNNISLGTYSGSNFTLPLEGFQGGNTNYYPMDPNGHLFSGQVMGTVSAVQDFYGQFASGVISGYLPYATTPIDFRNLWNLRTGSLDFNATGFYDSDNYVFRVPDAFNYPAFFSPGSKPVTVLYNGNASVDQPDVATLRISGVNFPQYIEFNITGHK